MIRVAVTGPESTGKSRLARELSAHYRVPFVPEFARIYIEGLDGPYVREDIVRIARGQLALERETGLLSPPLMICDTELIVTKIWSLHKYGDCDPFILEKVRRHTYDLYLLCDIDMPWEADDQREHPHLREYFFSWYRKELESYGFPYHVVRGQGEQRLLSAIQAIDPILK